MHLVSLGVSVLTLKLLSSCVSTDLDSLASFSNLSASISSLAFSLDTVSSALLSDCSSWPKESRMVMISEEVCSSTVDT